MNDADRKAFMKQHAGTIAWLDKASEHAKPLLNGGADYQPQCIDFDPPSYLPMREPLPPRIPDLCPDEVRDERPLLAEATARFVVASSWFPHGVTVMLQKVLNDIGLARRDVRVEWVAEHATVIAYVAGIEPSQTDTIMSAAIPLMPFGIGIDVRVATPHNPETCRDPACHCFPF
jgi:hypothetical protein